MDEALNLTHFNILINNLAVSDNINVGSIHEELDHLYCLETSIKNRKELGEFYVFLNIRLSQLHISHLFYCINFTYIFLATSKNIKKNIVEYILSSDIDIKIFYNESNLLDRLLSLTSNEDKHNNLVDTLTFIRKDNETNSKKNND